jgi:hypothetical protein
LLFALEMVMKQESKKTRSTYVPVENTNWLQRLGVAGFIFFLAKGLVWIVAAAWLVY